MADRHTALDAYGLTLLPHIEHMIVGGPLRVTGVSDNPVRDRIFSCRPLSPAEEGPCAREIITRLGAEAYRRPLSERDLEGLMVFYDLGVADGGFESGIQMALQAIL